MSRVLQPEATAKLIVSVAAIVQLASLVYPPWLWLPSRALRAYGDAVIVRVAAIPGPVYWPDHPWYLRLAGKPTTGHEEAVGDVMLADPQGWGARLEQEMAEAVARRKYSAVVVDFEGFRLRPRDFDLHYEAVASNLIPEEVVPPAGGPRRPAYLYLPQH